MRFHLTPRLRLAFACLALLAGLSISSTAAQAAPSFSTGIVDIDAFHFDEQLPFQRTKAAGAKYLKNNLWWHYVVPDPNANDRPGTSKEPFVATDPGSSYYNWSIYDRLVRRATANGLTPILTITNSPRWARARICRRTDICTPKPDDFADFATAAAKRYNGTFDPGDGQGVLPRVAFWQAWVEPNLFYAPIFRDDGTPLAPYKYRDILNAFYKAIHDVNDSNVVISAGLAPNGVEGKAIAPLDFTRRALCMKGNFRNPKPKRGCRKIVKADVWAIHPYTSGAPAHLPSNGDNMSVGALPRMTKLIRAANRAGNLRSNRGRTRVWATEFSWDSNRPDPGGLNWNEHARWVAEAMFLMFRARVDTMIWFGLRDEDRNGRPWPETYQSGLYLRGNSLEQDKPKKVLKVFRNPFYAKLGRKRFRFWGRTPDSKPARIAILGRRKGRGRFVRVGTAKANSNGIYSGFLRRRGLTRKGAIRSKVRGGPYSVPFRLYRTKDRFQPPFG